MPKKQKYEKSSSLLKSERKWKRHKKQGGLAKTISQNSQSPLNWTPRTGNPENNPKKTLACKQTGQKPKGAVEPNPFRIRAVAEPQDNLRQSRFNRTNSNLHE
jgi:hypothetical protein